MNKIIDENIFLLLQINDSLFPIGAYSHSYGLETYIQKELVKDVDTAFNYIRSCLKTNVLYTELLSIYLAYDYAKENNLKEIIKLEEIINASKIPKEIRLASQKLGSRFIKTLESINIKAKSEIFNNYNKRQQRNTAYSFSCIWSILCISRNRKNESYRRIFIFIYISSYNYLCKNYST